MKFALPLAGLLCVFAPSRAGAHEICVDAAACFDDQQQSLPQMNATADCDDNAFSQAVGTCDEPGTTMEIVPSPVPARAPLTCDGPSCRPQPAPIGAAGSHGTTFFQPVALLGTLQASDQASAMIVTNDVGGPRAGFCLRIERPPRC